VGARVVFALEERLGPLAGMTIEVHAGEDYVNCLCQAFGEKGLPSTTTTGLRGSDTAGVVHDAGCCGRF